jgi:hypothetical protein
VLRAKVHIADIPDPAAVPLLLEGADDQFPRPRHLWVDRGYTGSGRYWIEAQLGWSVEVVRHPPRPQGEWCRTATGVIGVPWGSPGNAWRRRRKTWGAAQALGGVQDLRMAVPELELESRLRTALSNDRGPHLRRQESADAPQVGSKLTLHTVFGAVRA